MSIHSEIGKPGAGKSYEAVRQVEQALKIGRCVVTNLPIAKQHEFMVPFIESGQLVVLPSSSVKDKDPKEDFARIDLWERFTLEDNEFMREIETGKKGESSKIGALIIIDEAQNVFVPMIRDNRKEPHEYDQLCEFLRTHRHALVDIILLYHDHTSVDGKLKPLIERWHHIVNTTELYGANTYTVKTSTKGYVAGNKGYISETRHAFKKEIFALYDSYSEGAGQGTKGRKGEGGLRKMRSIWFRPSFLFLVISFLALLFLLPNAIGKARSVIKPDTHKFTKSKQETPSHIPVQTGVNPQPRADHDKLVQHTLNFRHDGLPTENSPFIGFDNLKIYFGDGHIVERDVHLTPKGWRVLEARPCSIVIEKRGGDDATSLINYRCRKGY